MSPALVCLATCKTVSRSFAMKRWQNVNTGRDSATFGESCSLYQLLALASRFILRRRLCCLPARTDWMIVDYLCLSTRCACCPFPPLTCTILAALAKSLLRICLPFRSLSYSPFVPMHHLATVLVSLTATPYLLRFRLVLSCIL